MGFLSGRKAALGLLVLLPCLLYAGTLRGSFLWDDEILVVDNANVRAVSNIPRFFTLGYWMKDYPGNSALYRPLRSATFALDYALWGLNPKGFHATNLLLYILSVLMAYFLVWELFKDKRLALMTALLFAAHPIHTEAVAWIKNRAEVLCFIFYTASFAGFIKARGNEGRSWAIPASLLAFLLALGSKEMAVTLPVMLAAYVWFLAPPDERADRAKRLAPYALITTVYLAVKFGIVGVERPEHYANAFAIGFYPTVLSVFKTVGGYLWLLVVPVRLCAEHAFIAPRSMSPGVVFGAAALAGVAALVLSLKKRPGERFSLAWMLAAMLPAANIAFLYSRPFAEQRLFLPSLGFCLLLALLISRAPSQAVSGGLLVAVLMLYSTKTLQRNLEWADPVSLWRTTAAQSPTAWRARSNLGEVLRREGLLGEARKEYEISLKLNPAWAKGHVNLGTIYYDQGDFGKAAASFKEAISLDENLVSAHNNLGNAYSKIGESVSAVSAYERALELQPGLSDTRMALIKAYGKLGMLEKVKEQVRKAAQVGGDER